MFGKNVIMKLDTQGDGRIAVQSIFYTLQGEGPYMLMPAVFIRLAGCHLACTFCDTDFDSGISNRMTPAEIMSKVYDIIADLPFIPMFVVTGGEPLRQDISGLLYLLRNSFREPPVIQLETAGSIMHPNIPESFFSTGVVDIVCSPKTKKLHPIIAKYCKHYKYVLKATDASSEDGLPSLGTQAGTAGREDQIARPPSYEGVTVWVSPCDEKVTAINAANTKACVDTAMHFGYRVSLQTHKILELE